MKRNRVVITGIGVLAANGIGKDEFWRTLIAGQSGIGPITLFDAENHRVQMAGEVKNFNPARHIPFPVKSKRMGRHTLFALSSAFMAIRDAKIDEKLHEKMTTYVGVSTSAIDVIENGKEMMIEKGPRRVGAHIVGACQPNAVVAAIKEVLGIETETYTVSTACAAGMDALARAFDVIADNRTDLVLVGGVDAPITPLTVACFGATSLVGNWDGPPSEASRPFDRMRQGGILAEGAAFFVMESLDHALARGVTPYIELLGHSGCVDPAGSETAEGFNTSIAAAMENARTTAQKIDYVCAHGPSDETIDRVETQCIKKCLGNHAYRIPVSSIKGVTGNPLAAAGPLQLAATALAMRGNLAPPTANHQHPDANCDLDYVPLRARNYIINRALINVHGMGGLNNSLIVQRIKKL